jgi:hypothetical protein
VEEAGSESTKPKYLNELFILLRVVLLCPEVAKLKGSSASASPAGGVGTGDDAQLWEPFKAALTVFTAKGLGKQKDLRKNHSLLARRMGLALDETITAPVRATAAAGGRSTTTKSSSSSSSSLKGGKVGTAAKSTRANGSKAAVAAEGESGVMTTTKKPKSNRPGDKEKKEAKKRRMTASAEGFTDVTFAQVDMDIDVPPEVNDNEPESPLVAQEVVGHRKKRSKETGKSTAGIQNTNGNQVESLVEVKEEKSKKKKTKKNDKSLQDEETSSPLSAVDGNLKRKTCLTFKSTTTSFFLFPVQLLNLINIDCRRIGRQETEKEADDSWDDGG